MIMKNMRPAIPLLILAALPAWGDAVSLSFNQHATKNVFQTSDAVADQISVFSLAFDKDLSALSLLGRAEYSAFHQTTGMSFFAALHNALDRRYMEVLGYPALGRHFRLGVRLGS